MYLGNILLLRSCFVFFTHHKMHFSDVRCTQGTKRRDEYAFFSNVLAVMINSSLCLCYVQIVEQLHKLLPASDMSFYGLC